MTDQSVPVTGCPSEPRTVSEDSWQAFLESLYAPLPSLREMAVLELPRWAELGRDVSEVLALSINDEVPLVVRAAVMVAGRLRVPRRSVVEALERRLVTSDELLRRTVVTALGRIGSPAFQVLARLLNDRDPFIAEFVQTTLAIEGEPAVSVLLPLLSDLRLRQFAAAVLVRIGPPAIAHLMPLLNHADSEVRFLVTDTLEQIGPVVLPTLLDALRQSGAEREGAAAALPRFGIDAIPGLIELLSDANVHHRCSAAAALVQHGVRAVPFLVKALEHKNTGVAWLAAKSLGQIGPSAIPDMAIHLGRTARSVRWILADVLRQMGSDAALQLEKELSNPDPLVREAVAHILGDIGE
ncbi:MAG TPA: HEAT repeat domain-containing protein, partial [Candidatus Ozemobacteraceae bacterium]|nr:HEAT repeat domain-containing protein [Candidatus Ozemobacteraceae bacterium]